MFLNPLFSSKHYNLIKNKSVAAHELSCINIKLFYRTYSPYIIIISKKKRNYIKRIDTYKFEETTNNSLNLEVDKCP